MKNILVLTDKLDNQGNWTNGMKVYKAFRKLGHTVSQGNHTVKADKLKGFDLILAFGTLLYPDRVKHVRRIARAKGANAVLTLWYFDACNPAFHHSKRKCEAMRKAIPWLDWLVMTDASYPWGVSAKNFLHLMQGVDPDDFNTIPSYFRKREHDVIFTGGFRGAFKEREKMLRKIRQHFSLQTYGRNSKRRAYGHEFFRAHQKARVAFVPPPPPAVAKRYWSNRIYLAAATGTPCVAGYVDGLEDHFGDDVLYFWNTDEMIEAIQFLIDNREKAGVMGMAARKRVLTDHTYEKRAETLLETIFG
jgi:spore maturation protein CgeB